jgi:anti-sigma-K factor RskA
VSDTHDQFHDDGAGQDERPTGRYSPHDALEAYALGTLDVTEQRQFELHLFVCAACRAELETYHRVAGVLPYALPAEQPPAGARERLLARARDETSEAPTVSIPALVHDDSPTIVAEAPTLSQPDPGQAETNEPPTVEQAVEGQDIVVVPTVAVSQPATIPSRSVPPRRGTRIKLASLGWAAALLFTIASGLFVTAWSGTGPHASFETWVLARLPGGQVLTLQGTGVPTAKARLYVVENGRRAELEVDDLAPLPAGRVYQLWFAEADQPTRTGGAFGVNPRGDAAVPVTIPIPLERVRAIAITQEPAPGLTSPTGAHLLDWTP